jgi:hypothetical protein
LYEDLDSHVVDPTKRIVYQLTNSLGFTSEIPFNVDTGAFLGGPFINGSGLPDFQPYTGGAVDFQFNNGPPPGQPLGSRSGQFHHNLSPSQDELFVVRGTQSSDVIERLNAETGAFIQHIPTPAGQTMFRDFTFDATDRLHAATDGGVFVYSELFDRYGPVTVSFPPAPPIMFENPPQLLIPGAALQVAAAPGNSLLVQSATGTINRYDAVTGAPLGAFLTHAALGADSIGQFEVTPDGVAYVLSYLFPPAAPTLVKLSRVNAATGQILTTVELDSVANQLGQLFVLPVPEPATISLAFFALAVVRRAARCPARTLA